MSTQHLEEAKQLHQELICVDAHHDIPMDVLAEHKKGNYGVLSRDWSPRLTEGGVNVQVMPAFIEDRYLPASGLREMVRMTEAMIHDLEHDDSRMAIVVDGAGIDRVLSEGKIAALLALEGCDGLGGDPSLLRALYRLGVRMVAFTWDRRNGFADGTGVANPGGLTDAGRAALKEMQERRVIFDVSHLAEPGFWDAMDVVSAPIVASHSNAKAVRDHRRNLTDAQIKAIADTGGVIGLNFYGGFIDAEQPTVEHMADHLDHMVKLVGIEHIGIGADFLEDRLLDIAKIAFIESAHDPAMLENWIPNCKHAEDMPRFTAVMLERGYNKDEIAAVLGGNFLRVFKQVLG